MSIIAPVYSAPISCIPTASNVQNLANTSGVCAGIFDMNAVRYCDVQFSILLYSPSYSPSTGFIGLYLLPSHDGTMWGDSSPLTAQVSQGTAVAISPSTCPNMKEIALIPMASSTLYWSDTLVKYVGALPSYFTVYVQNYSGGPLGGSGYAHQIVANYMSYEFV